MLRGEKVGLRARHEGDIPVLEAELYGDVVTRSGSDTRPWLPLSPGTAASPYAIAGPADDSAAFSVIDLASDELAGEAGLWRIDTHNRNAHIGISLRPAFRRRGLAVDVVRVLCDYGFTVRGLHRMQIETLAENAAMIRTAVQAGFTQQGHLPEAAWVNGAFVDEVILGLVVTDWVRRDA